MKISHVYLIFSELQNVEGTRFYRHSSENCHRNKMAISIPVILENLNSICLTNANVVCKQWTCFIHGDVVALFGMK